MSDQSDHEQNQGALAQEILNRILTDEDFRKQLVDNPAEVLTRAGYIEGDDVSGYTFRMGPAPFGSHTDKVLPSPAGSHTDKVLPSPAGSHTDSTPKTS